MRLPNPPLDYELAWSSQYSRVLEQEVQNLWSAIQLLQRSTLPSYTTAEKITLTDRAGWLIFDSTLGKACINTGSGWETITSV